MKVDPLLPLLLCSAAFFALYATVLALGFFVERDTHFMTLEQVSLSLSLSPPLSPSLHTGGGTQDGGHIRGGSSLHPPDTKFEMRVTRVPPGVSLLGAYRLPHSPENSVSRTVCVTDVFDSAGVFQKETFDEQVRALYADLVNLPSKKTKKKQQQQQ